MRCTCDDSSAWVSFTDFVCLSLAHDSIGNAIGRFDGMYVDD
jgi:hypothetical protein